MSWPSLPLIGKSLPLLGAYYWPGMALSPSCVFNRTGYPQPFWGESCCSTCFPQEEIGAQRAQRLALVEGAWLVETILFQDRPSPPLPSSQVLDGPFLGEPGSTAGGTNIHKKHSMSETFLVREDCADALGEGSLWVLGVSGRKARAHLDQFHGVRPLEERFLGREALHGLVQHIQLGVDGTHPVQYF